MLKIKPNSNNPKGLFKNQGVLYSVLGFFNYLDNREMYCDMRGDLPDRITPTMYQAKGVAGISIPNCYPMQIDTAHAEKLMDAQLKNLNLNPRNCYAYNFYFQTVFVFKKHVEPVAITDKFTKDPLQALLDFFEAHDKVPLIMTENAVIKAIATSMDKQESPYQKDIITKDDFYRYLKRDMKPVAVKAAPTKTSEELEKERLKELDNTPDFTLCSDYEHYSKKYEIDLFDLKNRINQQAKRKGGFIDFTFKGKVYKIPKLPLIAWINRGIEFKYPYPTKHVYHNDTWYCVSPEDLKTNQDDPVHSDWWIGAGFPIEAYSIIGHGNSSFFEFNRHLSEFASEMSDNNRLDNVKLLAGADLSPVQGRLNIYPSSLDEVSEGDILVLSHAGVDFDLYIKKACANGKGAAIVEIGNKVAHLSIISNELGFRLILLPSASEMLKPFATYEINPSKREIIPIKSD